MWTYWGLVFAALCCGIVQGQLRTVYESQNSEVRGGAAGNAGLKIKITQKALDEINNALVAALNVEFQKIHVPHYVVPGTGQYVIELDDLRITSFTPPKSSQMSLRPPNSARLFIQGLSVGLGGKFTGGIGAVKASGNFDGKANDINIDMALSASRSGSDIATKVDYCSSTMGPSDFNVNVEGIIGVFLKQRKGDIDNLFRGNVPAIVCKLMENVAADLGASLVREAPSLLPIVLVDESTQPKPLPPHIKVLAGLQQNLKMDNSLIRDITVNDKYAETQHRGEIRYYDGLDSTLPFHPSAVNDEPASLDRSLYVTATEYILNSLMYHAYRRDKLNLDVNRSSLPDGAKDFLNTSCSASGSASPNKGLAGLAAVCIGKLIPALTDNYPNNYTSLQIIPQGIPVFSLRNGTSYLNLTARILTLIDEGWRQFPVLISRSKVMAKSDYELSSSNKFVGKLELEDFSMEVHRSALKGLDPNNVEQLGPLSKAVLGKELAKTANQGIQLPTFQLFRLRRPVYTVGEGFGQLASDLTINQQKLEQLIGEAIRRGSASLG